MADINSSDKVVIFGAGGFARLAYTYLTKDSPYQVVAFTVHSRYQRESTLLGLEVIPFEDITRKYPQDEFSMFVAIGYEQVNRARAGVYDECKRSGYRLISYISSRATSFGELSIGDNVFIFENNSIHPFVTIGNDVIVGSGNQIGHDTVVEDHCFLAGHVMLPGYTHIGAYSFLGANSTFRDGINIGSGTVVGAGAVILKDTKPGEVYIADATKPAPISSSTMGKLMHSPYFRINTGERINKGVVVCNE